MAPALTISDQVDEIRYLVAQQVDALIIGAIDGTAPDIALAAQEAVAADVPVIAVNMEIRSSQIACTVRADGLKGGRLAAGYLVEQLGGQGKVILITSESPMLRVKGFRDTIDEHPDCEIGFEGAGDWSRESGKRVMREGLAACPDARGVFATNDPMAHGALEAIEEAGKTGEIVVVGYDGLAETFRAIHDGTMGATVSQSPYTMGHLAVERAMSILQGESVQPLTLTDVKLVTADNLVEAAVDKLELYPGMLQSLLESSQSQHLLQQEVIEAQQLALQELSTPVIPVLDTPQGGIIVLPLIGSIDSMRASNITRALLTGIREHQAAVVILDITGVSIVDSGVANHLNKTIRAARLKGAQAIITGVSEAVAETIVDLGIDWGSIDTLSDLQTGLVVALHSLGMELGRR
jgi:ABC-type sugar transport system substrate-binding protein/anti-anti-sigma regulatory factor